MPDPPVLVIAPEQPDCVRRPSFRLYVFGSSVSAFGTQMAMVALPIALIAHGADAGALGLVLGASLLPKMMFLLLGGIVSDRLDRRSVLIAGDVMMAVAQAATALLLLADTDRHLYAIAVAQVLYGCADAFSLPAVIGVMPQLVPRESLQRANVLLRTSTNTASVIGPAVAAGIAAGLGAEWALIADALTFVVAMATRLALPKATPPPSESPSMLRDLAAGWQVFRRTTWVWLMVVTFAIYQATVLPAVFVIGPLLTAGALGAAGWAAVLTARSVGAMLSGAVLMRWRPTRPVAAACALLLLDLPFLAALSSGWGLVALAAAAALSALGLAAADILWESSLQEHIDPHVISRISSYDWIGSVLFSPVGFLTVGIAATALGTESTILALAALHVVIHVLLPLSRPLRGVRRGNQPAPVS